jgi:hypothetical protein
METVKLHESLAGVQQLSGIKWRAKLIAADAWGSSAYYTAEALERDGARVFHTGLPMFQDHLTESEKWDRPEGSVEKLVGKLASDGEYEPNGAEGPGLYADVEFYPSYVSRITEIGKDVGLSVNAQGLTESGERDGRFGPILLALLSADSVDVVTRAGAGGKLTSIIESDRGLAGRPIEQKENQSMTDVTKEDFEALTAKITELPNLFVEALKGANFGAPAATTEAVVDASAATTETVTDTTSTTAVDSATTEPVIDHVAIVEALRTNDLPAVSASAIVADIKAGKTIDEAVKAQVALREAYAATKPESGAVHLQESASEPRGLARAVKIL